MIVTFGVVIVVGFGIGAPLNSTTADLTGSGSVPFLPPIIFSAIVGTRKFGALSIGRGIVFVCRIKGFGAGAETIFSLGWASSSNGETLFSGKGFGDSCFVVVGMVVGGGTAGGTIGGMVGFDVGINSAIGGCISSTIFGTAASSVIGL
jgi:hypothetical protein